MLLDPPGAYGPKGARFFHPIATGRVEAVGDGSVVKVHLRPVWSDLLAAALTIGIVSTAAGLVAAGFRGSAAVEGRGPSGWVRLGVPSGSRAGWPGTSRSLRGGFAQESRRRRRGSSGPSDV